MNNKLNLKYDTSHRENEIERIKFFIPFWQGRSIEDIYTSEVLSWHFNYNNIKEGCCLVCQLPFPSDHQLFPENGVSWPNIICDRCQTFTLLPDSDRCFISGVYLSEYDLAEKRKAPNSKVTAHISSENFYARDFFTILACKIVGFTGIVLEDIENE